MTVRYLGGLLLVLGGASLLALMAISVSDALMRALDAPFVGAKEISEACLAVCVAIALPVSVFRGKAVTIDGVLSLLPNRIATLIATTGELIGAGLCALLSYHLIYAGYDAADFSETTALLKIPHAHMYWVLALGAGLTAPAFAARAWTTFQAKEAL